MSHYLLIVLPDGKHAVRREYLPLLSPEETIPEAVSRWIENHPDMVKRQRNRDKVAERIRSKVLELRLCHPTSWHEQQAEEAGLPFPVPPHKAIRRRGR